MERKKKILIIDDNINLLKELTALLNSHNYTVVGSATNYDTALTIIAETLPDFIILDPTLRGEKNGIDLANFIRNNYSIPYAFLSRRSDSFVMKEIVSTKPVAFFKKNYSDQIFDASSVEYSLVGTIEVATYQENSPAISVKVIQDLRSMRTSDYSIKKSFDYNEILSIESLNKYWKNKLLIQTTRESYCTRSNLTLIKFELQLPPYFIQINNSLIINIHKLTAVRLPHFLVIENRKYKIGPKFSHNTLEQLSIYSRHYPK